MKKPLPFFAVVRNKVKGGSRESVKTSVWSWKQLPLFLSLVFLPMVTRSATSISLQTDAQIYWGAYMNGEYYGLGNAPWEARTIETFEANAGKRVSIIHWGQFWHWSRQSGYSGIGDGFFQRFETALYEQVSQRGAIPMINWNSWSGDAGGSSSQSNYQLIDIINGNYDDYIRQWARDAKAWGQPFFLRFDHEMNGNWYPWSEQTNGNQPGQYVQMWRHVHDIFQQEGATNVTWVWSVNTVYSASSRDLTALYPGDSYVDWVAIDGYNWGTNPSKADQWKTFSQVFTETYDLLGQVAPNKPVMLSEFSSTEYGGSKADWITDALTVQIPTQFPRIKAVVWFNWNCYEGSGEMDWIIESSSSAQNAFASGIQSPIYAANNFANLPAGKVQPLTGVQSTPPPPAATPVSGDNLILNPSYEATGSSWLSPWRLNVGSGAAGSVAQESATQADGAYSALVTVNTAAPSAPWGVQLNQRNIALDEASTVKVSFWAKAGAARDIQVVVQMDASPYTEYTRQTFTLSTDWQLYSFSYSQPASDSLAMLSFNAAQATGQVWVDQAVVSVEGSVSPAATATPILAEPTPTQTQSPSTATPTSTQPLPTATPVSVTPTATLTQAVPAASPTTNVVADTQSPTIGISSPADGSSLPRKQVVEIQADSSDNVGVDRVDFLVQSRNDYFWSCSTAESPYSCSWTVPAQPWMAYTIRAVAYDLAGNSAFHDITVQVVK
jgi:beta-mannanase